MNGELQLVVFMLDDVRYALPLSVVERATQAVYITPLPQAPGVVLGVLNVQGRIVPVFNTRKRFGLPERDIRLEDQMLLARTATRTVALLVDTVHGVLECSDSDVTPAGRVWEKTDPVAGVLKRPDGLILIDDLEAFLTADERHMMERALNATTGAP